MSAWERALFYRKGKGELDCDLDMETGLLNFHDEEHFEFGDESNDLVNGSSIFSSFVEVFNHQDGVESTSWILPDAEPDLGLESVAIETKEDFQKTLQDWQQHISSLQARDNDIKDALLYDVSEDMPDIFGTAVTLPVIKVPHKKKVQKYEVAKRKGLVLKLTKKKDDDDEGNCDNANPKRKDKVIIKEDKPAVQIKQEKVEGCHDIELLSQNEIWVSSAESIASDVKQEYVHIKEEKIDYEEAVDIENIGTEPFPVLEAGDVTTLLEQFESSNAVSGIKVKSEPLDSIEMTVKKEPEQKKQKPPLVAKQPQSNRFIMESLPKEVIDRIKESSQRNKKSKVALVPAERLPMHGNDHLKDKGVSLTKPAKPVSGHTSSGETAQLDHDYCTNQQQEKAQSREDQSRAADWERKWGDSKKDSGLESGDVSDASETQERGRGKPAPACSSEAATFVTEVTIKAEEVQIINIKKESETESGDVNQEPKKKKLNLEEYRKLRKNAKPRSPIKSRQTGWNIPTKQEVDSTKKAEMVNAEVQVQIDETKHSDNQEDATVEKCDQQKGNERLRRRSSSSSSCESKSRYHRRGRSKKRRHSRSQRSYWSYSRSRSRSRSRSHSRSSSYSYSSSSSRSRSRSRGGSRRRHRSRSGYHRNSSYRYSRRSPKRHARRSDDWSPVEKMRQVEERRVIYVGRLEEGTTKAQLRERFACFGPIVDISLHFREKGDNYGFVTFAYKIDAYEAVEHGNDYPLQPKYDICFGGRRAFCKQRYSDLDGTSPQAYSPHQQNSRSSDSFDNLLREAQKKLLKRSSHV